MTQEQVIKQLQDRIDKMQRNILEAASLARKGRNKEVSSLLIQTYNRSKA